MMASVTNVLPVDVGQYVGAMLERGRTELDVCRESLLPLLERDDSQAVLNALKMFDHVPEELLVKCLNYFLDAHVNRKKQKRRKRRTSDRDDEFDDEDNMNGINTILRFSYTDIFLQEQLKRLSPNNAKVLLKYLCNCIESSPQKSQNQILRLDTIIDWLCVLLDAHFHTITLSGDKEFLSIFTSLDASLKDKCFYLDEMEKVEILVEDLRSRKEFPVAHRILPYSIEPLVIP